MISQNSKRNENKLLVVFGTRPEAIKMAPVVTKLCELANTEVRVCVTAQHREMLDQVLTQFSIVPDYDLDLMRPGQSLIDTSTRVLQGVGAVCQDFKPDWVFVHGDTNTTLAASLAAYYNRARVAHIEAGLRTSDKWAPFPEEINRRLTGHVADLHFAPTESAKKALLNEGIVESTIHVTGNTVIDSLFLTIDFLKRQSGSLQKKFPHLNSRTDSKKILVTCHRRENFGEGIDNLCKALKRISNDPHVEIVYPVHPNPNIEDPVKKALQNCSNIHLINPLAYPEFVAHMQWSDLILTDSGGVQEEAPSLGKPVLVLRHVSERPEAVEAGTVKLVGCRENVIVEQVQRLLRDEIYYKSMSQAQNPYGDGKASSRVLRVMSSLLKKCPVQGAA